jgi:hypothetical protein
MVNFSNLVALTMSGVKGVIIEPVVRTDDDSVAGSVYRL